MKQINSSRSGGLDDTNKKDINQMSQSTIMSIDFAPIEHEQQMQKYEAEVRNHIKV